MDYGPAPEGERPTSHAWLEQPQGRLRPFHRRQVRRRPQAARRFDVINPADGDAARTGRARHGRRCRRAPSTAARKALRRAGRALSGHERARHLYAIARHVQKHERFFAVLETIDNGKPIRESRDIDVPLVARHFYHHAGWAAAARHASFPDHVPVGVCRPDHPVEFPAADAGLEDRAGARRRQHGGAEAGRVHAADRARSSPRSASEAGLPPGVVNIVTGDGDTGALIVEHPDVDKIAFTGSTEVGRIIRKATAGTGKKLSLELGGKSPFIVFDDADLDSAVEGVVDAIWFNQGQVCCAGSRLLVQEGVADALHRQAASARMETLRVGDPLDKSIDIGADRRAGAARAHRARWSSKGEAEGATLLAAGHRAAGERLLLSADAAHRRRARLDPSRRRRSSGRCWSSMTFRTPDEAVALANNTRYGLAASRLEREHQPRARRRAAAQGRRRLGQLHQPVRRRRRLRRLPRESASAAKAGAKASTNISMPAWAKAQGAGRSPRPSPQRRADARRPIRRRRRSTARQSSLSAASRRGRMAATATPSLDRKGSAGRRGRRSATARTSATPSRRPRAAGGWGAATAHNRAQVLYYLAENLAARADEFAARLARMTGVRRRRRAAEVDAVGRAALLLCRHGRQI